MPQTGLVIWYQDNSHAKEDAKNEQNTCEKLKYGDFKYKKLCNQFHTYSCKLKAQKDCNGDVVL